mmetsp:Transcript_68285/g.188963  ORF Transcript_68285/g.188963 Transcript_68285/m.188963 type:complete len:81 (+) Transcript_68285:656-898(+)
MFESRSKRRPQTVLTGYGPWCRLPKPFHSPFGHCKMRAHALQMQVQRVVQIGLEGLAPICWLCCSVREKIADSIQIFLEL